MDEIQDKDFLNAYNTPLEADDEEEFKGWLTRSSKNLGRDISNDLMIMICAASLRNATR